MKVCPKCNAHYENDTFFCLNDGTPLKQTESVVVKKSYSIENAENESEETVVIPASLKEIKTVRPLDQIDNTSEATIVRERTRSKEKTDNQPPFKKDMFSPHTGLSFAESDRSYTLKTAGLGALILVIFIGLCGWIALVENQNSSFSENKPPADTAPTDPAETTSELVTVDFPAKPTDDEPSNNNRERTRPTALPSENTTNNEEKSAADKTVEEKSYQEGKISGKLVYPGEEIPSNMHLCLENTNKSGHYCSDEQNGKPFFELNRSKAIYTAYAPPGTYYIYAKISGKNEKAYHTEFVTCGMSTKCRSHKKIPIRVKNKQTVRGIDVGDWYDF
jgi:hypothetical protein